MVPAPPCPTSREWQRFVLGMIDEDEATGLELHLAGCRACLGAVQGLQSEDGFVAALHGWQTPPPRAPDGVVERLKQMVRALPSTQPGDPGNLHTPSPPGDTTGYLDLLAPPRGPGELGRFGPYAVLDVLGSGGMGLVFRARQARPQRLVALKMIRAGAQAGRERLARFRAETEVVARLVHPNIVHVYEAGVRRGQPYFTMEYVDGGSLAHKLAASPLAARPAAELVEALARAVHFAHGHGFIHRDLKPSNVLLTADGVPKVGDFGLAKQLAEPPGDDAPEYRTESGALLGTPGYMAPEQATGRTEDVGPAADTYALGAILYECLTGRPPFRAATVLETLEQARTQEPVPPGRLQPGLPRDLQTICMKCLRKEPARRYATAQELADDLARFLRGEPIRARPVPVRERLLKWARRKPAWAALLAVSALSLAALVAGGLVYNARLRAAVERADANAAEARRQQERADAGYRAARDTLNRMLGRLAARRMGELPQLKELERDFLEDALAFYQGHLDGADNPDPAVRRDAAEAYERAAVIQALLGRQETAAENYRQAIELVEGLPPEDRDAPEGQALLARCYSGLGHLADDAHRWDEAERHHRAALEICERLSQARPDDPQWQSSLAESEHNLGVRYQLAGKLAEAEPHYTRAAAIRAGLVRDHPEEERYQAALAGNYINLGLMYQQTGRPAEAAPAYEKAEALLRPLTVRHPGDGDDALRLAGVHINWGNLLRDGGQTQDALARHTQAVELAEAVLRQEPRYSVARLRVYEAHGTRAQTCEALGRWAEAVKDWDRVVELDEQPDPWIRRVLRAMDLGAAGEHARAAAEAEALAANPAVNADGLWGLVIAYARSSHAARSDAQLPAAERDALAERYVSRAVMQLQKLHAQGYFKDGDHAQLLRTDADLEALRGRADFRKLLEAVIAEKHK